MRLDPLQTHSWHPRGPTTSKAIVVIALSCVGDGAGLFQPAHRLTPRVLLSRVKAVSAARRVLLRLTDDPQDGTIEDNVINIREVSPLHEVVGANGRIGNYLLRKLPYAMAVPRGVAPGSLSSSDTVPTSKPTSTSERQQHQPLIWAATPSSAWHEIYEATLPEQRSELIFCGNGLPTHDGNTDSCWWHNVSFVVPHFGILQVGGDLVTSTQSPPTYLYCHKDAEYCRSLADLLKNKLGVNSVEILQSPEHFQFVALRKLLWASCLWLLCHSADTDEPFTVAQVHDKRADELRELVSELWPVVHDIVGATNVTTTATISYDNLEATIDYLKNYSYSMPNAIPSLFLAKSELADRNGILLKHTNRPQKLHRQYLVQVLGIETVAQLDKNLREDQKLTKPPLQQIYLPAPKLTVAVEQESSSKVDEPPKSVVVVGAGILGCTVALALVEQCSSLNVTLVDVDTSIHGTTQTTEASWAWLNANQKRPFHYQWLNQLGLRTWRTDPSLKDLPMWKGSLVSSKDPLEQTLAGYSMEGPLPAKRILELEPFANFTSNDSNVYFFPDEGCVDPIRTIRYLRNILNKRGVAFVNGSCEKLVRDQDAGVVSGIEVTTSNGQQTLLSCDKVIAATGLATANKLFGGIPLKNQEPGNMLFAVPNSISTSTRMPFMLDRILVDAVRKIHVLQRKDGNYAIGGGVLELGGKRKGLDDSVGVRKGPEADSHPEDIAVVEQMMMQRAAQLVPVPIDKSNLSHSVQAVRPIPEDGLPVVGASKNGIYTLVTHSGFTLAPILGHLVAAEVIGNVRFQLLAPYRPNRFFVE